MDENRLEPTPSEGAPEPRSDVRDRVPRGKIHAFNWLDGVSDARDCDFVMVQFKNTRNGYYNNVSRLPLKIGDIVVVEASPGHDVGSVVMVGPLVARQMRKVNLKEEPKKIYRVAKKADLERFEEARALEQDTMIRSRKIAESLELNMKIGDVEYQGDGSKAIFYYIADERVDFRKLIRVLADTFKIRIEMRQIGARQEAGRIGGIGPCGRPLCCSSWMTRFISVGTTAARAQDLSMNPQKLAGQCAKLKCCLNFEVDDYMESQKKLPPKDAVLQTLDADYYFFKHDVLSRRVTYSTDKSVAANLVTIPARRAFEIIALNKQGVKVEALDPDKAKAPEKKEYIELVGQDSLTRFDKTRKKKKNKQAKSNPNKPPQRRNDNGKNNPERPRKPQHEKHEKPAKPAKPAQEAK